jgi:CBS domain-containing protein
MANVRDVLAVKGSEVLTIEAEATVLDATRRMNEHQVGAIVVMDAPGNVVGIFSERDVLRRVVAEQRDPATTAVREVMTERVVCCPLETDLHEVQALMRSQRIRHLPVIEDGKLVGLVSIRDVNDHFATDREVHIHYLHEYIYGRA